MSDEKQVLLSTADEVAKDYPFEQFIADLAGVTVEEIRKSHMIACGYIGAGLTPAAAIARLARENNPIIYNEETVSEGR